MRRQRFDEVQEATHLLLMEPESAAADEQKAEPRRKLSRGATERQLSLNDIAYGGDPSALIGAIPTAAAAAAGNPARAPKKAKGRPAQDRLPAIGDRRGRSAAA